MKYIFITGGVVSSVGKGLTAASIGALLESRGYKITHEKFDPYLNVDPGALNPYQHGEVYVLKDGGETDLDLGHYERFTHTELTRRNSYTSGRIYMSVIAKERRGEYAGQTVQVIPHITDEIKSCIMGNAKDCDILITEIGGTTGDIEGLPFLEAIREFALEQPRGDVIFIHVTLVPYIKAAGELKTKPTQQSVAKLREIGITPNVLICRCEHELDPSLRKKISLFCNVPFEAVVEEKDVDHSIYELPLVFQREGLDDLICRYLSLDPRTSDMSVWQNVVRSIVAPHSTARIAVVGEYVGMNDAYKSVYEALYHGCIANDARLELVKIDSEEVSLKGTQILENLDGIMIPGGISGRGIEGNIKTIEYARKNNIPFLGLGMGMQAATIEYARNVLGLKDANTIELDPKTPEPVVAMMDENHKVITEGEGTLRKGHQECVLNPSSKVAVLYGAKSVLERHRNRYEINSGYRKSLEDGNFTVAGESPDGAVIELIELKNHPFFVGCQFHPEFQSKPFCPHPLFKALVAEAIKRRKAK